MTTNYTPKTYTQQERTALGAEWERMRAAYYRDGTLPSGVKQLGTVFGQGAAGHAQPDFPVIAEIDGIPAAAVLEQLPPAVRYAVDMTYLAVEELQLPVHQRRGVQVIAARPGQVAEFGAGAITAFDPFAHTALIITAPQQGG